MTDTVVIVGGIILFVILALILVVFDKTDWDGNG